MKSKEKRFNYYEEFYKNASLSVDISIILKEFIEKFDVNNISEVVKRVHKLENDADRNLHNMLNFLLKDFLPPIEREDIVLLANKIDDTIDYLDEIMINLDILDVKELKDNFIGFMDIISKQSNSLVKMFEAFKDSKRYEEVHKLVIDINKTEEEGDRLFEKSIRELYKNEKDSIEVIRWSTIYNDLENCIDSYEKIASTLDEVILKNS